MKTIRVSAPGKVILFGEHAVVYGKTAIAVSLADMRVHLTMTLLGENKMIFNKKEYEIPKKEQDDEKSMEMLKSTFVHEPSMIAVFFIFFKWIPEGKGISIDVSTNIPIGSGLGSSSSFSVCLVTAALFVTDQITDLNSNLDMINEYAYLLECIFHGTPSGIDNSIATFGGALSFTKRDGIKRLVAPKSLKILITDTKIPKDTKKMVSGVRERYEKDPTEMTKCFDKVQEISEKCIQLFSQDAHEGFEGLFEQNQILLNQMGVGHKTIDYIVELTKQHGFPTKLTGGGGGGCVITYNGSTQVKEILEKEGFSCYLTDIGGEGVKLE